MKKKKDSEKEYDFALIVGQVPSLTTKVENALFSAGCDDATLSIRYGLLYMEFSRTAPSLADAILTAIQDVRKSKIGAEVIRVDDFDLVTPSEIARRINRSRQMVHQYINGQRGPGGFPPPECHLAKGSPLWAWCAVSSWLAQNDIVRPEESWNAEVVSAINHRLEADRQRVRNPKLIRQIEHAMTA